MPFWMVQNSGNNELGFHGLMVRAVKKSLCYMELSVGKQFSRRLQGSGLVGQESKIRVFFVFIVLLENVLHSLGHLRVPFDGGTLRS